MQVQALRDVRFGIGHRAWGMESKGRSEKSEGQTAGAEAIFFRYALCELLSPDTLRFGIWKS